MRVVALCVRDREARRFFLIWYKFAQNTIVALRRVT